MRWPCAIRPLAAAENAFPTIAAAYIVKNGDSVLWAGAERERLPPASLTKIMTALLVVEDYRAQDLLTVSGSSRRAPDQHAPGLRAGERMHVEDLLAATLLASAERRLPGPRGRLRRQRVVVRSARMNRRAADLGLQDTRFANACGFDAPGHLSSAADLAQLTEAALRKPVFAALVAQRGARIQTANGARTFNLVNTNALIGRLPGAVGVKSGYTSRAGRCLVALVERDGVRILMVLLAGRNRWWDTHGVIERAFAVARE